MNLSSPILESTPEAGATLGIISVIPRTKYTFHGSTLGVPPPATVIPLRTRIHSSEWTSGVLLVRLHAKTFPSTTSYVEVEVCNDGFTPEDPSTTFTEPLSRALATIPNGATEGTLYAIDTAQPIGAMLRVNMRFYQGTTTLGVSSVTLSVDLVGRKRQPGENATDDLPSSEMVLHRVLSPVGERQLVIELRNRRTSRSEWLSVAVGREATAPIVRSERRASRR